MKGGVFALLLLTAMVAIMGVMVVAYTVASVSEREQARIAAER